MTLDTMHDLLVQQLRDLYSAEKQITRALPKMVKKAGILSLSEAFADHLDQTERHVDRLNEAFRYLDARVRGPKCKGMEGLLEEGGEMLKMDGDAPVLDAGLIAAAQRVEHYEIAGYGSAIALASLMNHTEVVDLLEQTLAEEKAMDSRLTETAEEHLYRPAAESGSAMLGM